MKIRELEDLMRTYGNVPIGEIIEQKKGINRFVCPKCEGRGFTTRMVNMYPSGLPDSGWVEDLKPIHSDCDLCSGVGYTRREYKPKIETKIVGYE
jgi:hypothetical protein